MCSNACKQWFHLISSLIGVFLGVAAFVTFFCVYKNLDAGFWAFLSGMFALVCLHLHFLHLRQQLESWHSVDTLGSMKVLGVVGALVGAAGCIWYIFISLYRHIAVLPVGTSMFIAAVWAFMTSKWSLLLFSYCCMYERILLRGGPPLISI